jgi:hypothetical protein
MILSGHESFACRYGWLPKLYHALSQDDRLFADDENAIVTLGIGKNMVRSLRFWGSAFGLTRTKGRGVCPTEFAVKLLHPKRGKDPFLEDPASLWKLHWTLTTTAGLGAWTVAFLETPDSEITKQKLLETLKARAAHDKGRATAGTIAQHVDIFLRTYDGGNIQSNEELLEDTLTCPLQELGLLEAADVSGTPTIRFRRGEKASLDSGSFAYAVRDFWSSKAANSRVLSIRSIMFDPVGPGAVFRLDEGSVFTLLSAVCSETKSLELREDGAGGVDIVARQANPLSVLEEIVWH